jgi:hypothetical protein
VQPPHPNQKVKATVILEFEDGPTEFVQIENLEVVGSWIGKEAGQARPIWEVRHPSINGIYQHHNIGVAFLDLLRVAIIELTPDWCKFDPRKYRRLLHSSVPQLSPELADKLGDEAKRLLTSDKSQAGRS